MRVGILVPSIGNFGQKGFYNLQEVGLAKALDAYCEKVRVWRLVSEFEEGRSETIEGCKNATMDFVPAKQIGSNGIVDFSKIDRNLDVLLCFADTQLAIPSIYKWTVKNRIRFIPYIGVVESHSTNKIKQKIMDILFAQNLRVYKKCCCLVKTPTVGEALKKLGVYDIAVAPVGLDMTLLNENLACNALELKREYGYAAEEKIILFIGRLIEEKQPVRMVEIFSNIVKTDKRYRLLIVGTGKLNSQVADAVDTYGLKDKVRMIDRIPNCDVWKLYRFAEAFVNLNQQEIFGMAILEAMYYGCKVVAWKAPGPSLIIENGVSGWIVESNQQVIDKIKDTVNMGEKAHERIVREFVWDSTAKKICAIIGD